MRRPLIRSTLLAATLTAAFTGCQDSSNDRPAAAEPAARADARADAGADARADTRPAAGEGAGAARGADRAPEAKATPFTGTLRGDVAAIGGETTGWRLEGDAQTGGIDVDVSRVQSRAKQLDGQRVTLTGKMTTRSWPERGETQVLVVEKIEPAPVKEK